MKSVARPGLFLIASPLIVVMLLTLFLFVLIAATAYTVLYARSDNELELAAHA